jgi:hypothetical protein
MFHGSRTLFGPPGTRYHQREFERIKGFNQIIQRSQADCFHGSRDISVRRHHNNTRLLGKHLFQK